MTNRTLAVLMAGAFLFSAAAPALAAPATHPRVAQTTPTENKDVKKDEKAKGEKAAEKVEKKVEKTTEKPVTPAVPATTEKK